MRGSFTLLFDVGPYFLVDRLPQLIKKKRKRFQIRVVADLQVLSFAEIILNAV